MIKLILPLLLSLLPLSLMAGLYKGLDEEGNVVYSDTPFDNAEKLKLPPLSIVDAPKVVTPPATKADKDVEEADEEPVKYTRFQITAPTNQQVIWNSESLSVAMVLVPSLNVGGGDYISLLMDGKTVVKKSSSQLIQLPRAERGEHRLQALVRNKNGKVVKRTRVITVHIKQSVVPRKTPR